MSGVYLTCLVTFGGDRKAEAHFDVGVGDQIDLKHLMLEDEVTREFKYLLGADEIEDDELDNIKRQIRNVTGGT